MNGTNSLYNLKRFANQNGCALITALKRHLENEFLLRLSKTEYADLFVLRGKLLIDILTEEINNTDIDLLYIGKNLTPEKAQTITENIVRKTTRNNIELQVSSVENLDAARRYKGVCISIIGNFFGMRLSFNVNVGVGEALVHTIEKTEVNNILDESSFEISTYPVESIVAEKFDIVLRRFGIDECMNHLYDIYILASNFNFDGTELQRAVNATLQHRNNDCSKDIFERISAVKERAEIRRRFQHFKTQEKISITLLQLINLFRDFLYPIRESILLGGKWDKQWNAIFARWEEPMYIY